MLGCHLQVTSSVERVLGAVDSEDFISRTYQHVIAKCYNIVINYSTEDRYSGESLTFLRPVLSKT